MTEHYTDPDPDAERVEITFPTTLNRQIEVGRSLPDNAPKTADTDSPIALVAVHFEHPNGEEGIMLSVSAQAKHVGDAFDIIPDDPEESVVFPLKHKADGGYNFLDYYEDEDEGTTTIVMTREMYEDTRSYFIRALGAEVDE